MANDVPGKETPSTPPKRPRRSAAIAASAAIMALSVGLSLLIAEGGFRIAIGVPLTAASNWRLEGVSTQRIGERAIPDPKLGWTLKPGYRSEGFNTIGLGIRRNFDETDVRKGSILAVGDSFTEGFDEVNDPSTWPAHLEKIMAVPVVNGGVAGYATDQVVLRAEDLLPIIQPKTLVLGFTEVDVERAALSEAGAPKPYYTIDDSALVYHPPGAFDPEVKESVVGTALRGALSYSALSDYLLSRLAPKFWYPNEASVYKEVETDPLDVTCRLLARLKNQTDRMNVRLLLFLQYGGEIVLEEPGVVYDMRRVTECALNAGIQVLDQFASLKKLTHGDPDLVAEYYSVHGSEFGHMSSKGNLHAARLLAHTLHPNRTPVTTALDSGKPLQN